MIIEHGMRPDVPGLEVTETLIEEDLRYNPECPCQTRTCPQHGFCKYCVEHHANFAKMPPPPEFADRPPVDEEKIAAEGGYHANHAFPCCLRTPTKERERLAKKYIAKKTAEIAREKGEVNET